jgi:hypothetical protein
MDSTLRLALVLVGLVVLGEAGHLVFDALQLDLAHHVFHIVFPLIAFAVFATYAARDIRKNGWPTFSWRLAPSAAARERRP